MRLDLAIRGVALILAASAAGASAHPSQPDAQAWLMRIQQAAQRLNYSGTFVVMQGGGQTQTSRITHVFDRANERERVEVLDGAAVVVLRTNDEVKSYLPESKTILIERRRGKAVFPAILIDQAAALAEHYTVRKLEPCRVAGRDCHVFALDPRDGLRYGQRLWAETSHGLLLKSQTINERGEVVEQIAFTEIEIGGPVERYAARLGRPLPGKDWRAVSPAITPARLADSGWRIDQVPPGFRRMLEIRRGIGDAEVGHVVFSDGLASVSVFVEALKAGANPVEGHAAQGAVNVFRRRVGEHLVTVLGEAPPALVSRIGAAVEFRPGTATLSDQVNNKR
ncbi:MAG: MucB/RseB C-terminal domain-containing protein [Burkholderiales bacterium]|nr:MucB/RseB C-terminal domain-containing protein [Burkholderiales bacterium]